MRDWMWKRGQTRGWPVAGAIASLVAAVVIASATVTSAGSQALSGSQVQGCCVCRGTDGGSVATVRSCSDGVNVDTCVAQCKGENADSIAFGYKQTCSQGCAGFPTQGLR